MSGVPEAHDGASRAGQAATIAGVALFALYATTAARHLTWWDAGEFAAAFGALGVPHPPGTPLFVLLGRVWTAGLAPFGVTLAYAGALLAAACTAATGALVAWALARATGSRAAGIAAALCAGGMSTVWGSATEVEVYATATLLAACAVAAGHRAGLAPDAAARARWDALVAYLFALAVPLHLSALVAAPAAALLAASGRAVPHDAGMGQGAARTPAWRSIDRRRLALHLALAAAAAGAGSGRAWLVLAGLALAALLATLGRAGAPRAALRVPARLVVAFALGLAPLLAMLARARHDPAVNQGNPATWQALADVVARRQYAPAGLWPRQAPWWLQVGNLFEWADWQVAFGLSQTPGPSVARTALTVAFVALAVLGAAWHRRRDLRTFRAAALLLLGGTLGVAVWLNLKAGPSYGWGVLPDGAPREARERDYFLILGFWMWGAWAGAGAVALARSVARRLASVHAARAALAAGVALAALPIAANWRVADRRLGADARAPEAYAATLLASVPPNGVLVTGGDNDSYPLWHAQVVLGFRPDVAVVTTSLLPAPWYRAELARRHRLLAPAFVGPWRGEPATLAALTDGAIAEGRALVVGLGVGRATRAALAGADGAGPWVLHGAARLLARTAVPRQGMAGVLRGMPTASAHEGHGAAAGAHGGHGMHVEPERPPSLVDAPAALRDPDGAGVARVDTLVAFSATEALAQRWPALLDAAPRAGSDGVTAWALAQLRCPGAALAAVRAARTVPSAPAAAPAVRLEATCNRR